MLEKYKDFKYLGIGFDNQDTIYINRERIYLMGLSDVVEYMNITNIQEDILEVGYKANSFNLAVTLEGLDLDKIDNPDFEPYKEYDFDDMNLNIHSPDYQMRTTDDNINVLYRLLGYEDSLDVTDIEFVDGNKNIMGRFLLPFNEVEGVSGVSDEEYRKIYNDIEDNYHAKLRVENYIGKGNVMHLDVDKNIIKNKEDGI